MSIRYSEKQKVRLMSKVNNLISAGSTIKNACETAGVSKPTYWQWKKKLGNSPTSEIVTYSGKIGRPKKYKTKSNMYTGAEVKAFLKIQGELSL